MFLVQYRVGAQSMWHTSGLPTSLAAASGQARAVGSQQEDVQVRLVPVPPPGPKRLLDLKV